MACPTSSRCGCGTFGPTMEPSLCPHSRPARSRPRLRIPAWTCPYHCPYQQVTIVLWGRSGRSTRTTAPHPDTHPGRGLCPRARGHGRRISRGGTPVPLTWTRAALAASMPSVCSISRSPSGTARAQSRLAHTPASAQILYACATRVSCSSVRAEPLATLPSPASPAPSSELSIPRRNSFAWVSSLLLEPDSKGGRHQLGPVAVQSPRVTLGAGFSAVGRALSHSCTTSMPAQKRNQSHDAQAWAPSGPVARPHPAPSWCTPSLMRHSPKATEL